MFACATGPCTVLIADDVPDIRHMMRFWLDGDEDEFEVVGEASDGYEAVEQVKEQQPHAIILDLRMPLTSGLQFLRAIRAIRARTPGVSVEVLIPDRVYWNRRMHYR